MSSNAIGFWIQSADYSAVDHDPVDYQQACQSIRGHDWAREVARFVSMEQRGEDCCAPGIGFTRPADGGIEFFHACPAEEGRWSIYYQHPDRQTDASLGVDGATLGAVEKALRIFYTGGRAEIEAELEPYST